MKVAVIIAKFPSGWRTFQVGEEIADARAAFKKIKVEGSLVDKGEAASEVVYFDTTPDLKRKGLRTPEEVEALDAADEESAEETLARLQRLTDEKAKADGTAAAQQIAQQAVALVVSQVAGAAGALVPAVALAPQGGEAPTSTAAPVAQPMPAASATPVAPTPPAQPQPPVPIPEATPAPEAAAGGDEDEEGDAAARFGGKKKPAKTETAAPKK